jgi:hypothetical protein
MRIALVSINLCVRARQTALAAMAKGHEVHLLVRSDAGLREFNDQATSIATFFTKSQFAAVLRIVKPDIILVHDRPHQIVSDLLEVRGEASNAPIIHDVHDMFSLMVPGEKNADDSPFEDHSITDVDGLVFVSESNKRYAEARWPNLPPSVVSRSAVLGRFFPNMRGPHLGGAVWGGGLYAEPPNSPRAYIDQRELIFRLASIGKSTTVYHAPLDVLGTDKQYEAAGAVLGGTRGFLEMLYSYSRYDFGLYGQTTDHPQIHGTIPNKLFEYTAAGIPTLVINADEAGRYVEEMGIGIHIRRPEDLIYVHDKLLALRPKVWERRWNITREKETEALWPLCEKLITARRG